MPSFDILTNLKIQTYFQNEREFNGVYSRNNFFKMKDGAYVINLYEYKSIETHRILLHVNDDNVTYFNNFGVQDIPREI